LHNFIGREVVGVSFYILIIVVLALMMGPIVMLKPKPEQRRKEKLRTLARSLGLRFSLRNLPKLKTDLEAPGVYPVYYLPPSEKLAASSEWVLMRTNYEHESNFYREWDWQAQPRATAKVQQTLREFLPRAPDSVMAISAGSQGVCVFWREQGDETELHLICDLLRALEQQLASET
jgi:hypothetical protein